MPIARRWCRRCRGWTEHIPGDPFRFPPWRWVLFAPLLLLIHLAVERPLCLACLGRDGQADE
ncbi:MAG: hypothetical protein ACYC61_14155 [Isosphaeraceae bacterium]